ncbi:metallophosphoesterase [Methanolobus mangrovi]|uniref:Metallophosphoesterase n=1 Tax=Methanolobus mangrovi TaxID=3072977 RepID=A0AA51YJX4_9EURY|nr:metallophosphoesterase [Methanolobus mangrovi]WMW23090.1 metallophosphoesterase [Methanolobus mangrovi]
MRLFAIADPHGNYSKIEELLEQSGDIDVILIAGDITNFGPDEKALELIDMFKPPILAVPGNCDHESILEVIDNSRATNLHNGSITIDGVQFVGMGGSNPTPFCTPFEIEESDFETNLNSLMNETGNTEEPVVILTHVPPYGILDEVGGMHVGCKALSVFLDKADIMVCGHIHEARGIRNSGKTIIVNPGMAALGFAALIDINRENHEYDISIQLLEAGR